MSTQQVLTFPNPKPTPSASTLTGMVLQILTDDPNRYWTPWEICDRILFIHKVKVSDSSLTARIRELRRVEYGAHIIEKRPREGSRAYEYRIKL